MALTRHIRLLLALICALAIGRAGLVAPRPAQAASRLRLPDPPVSASYGPWLQGSRGSIRDLTLASVLPGYDVADGVYAAWCLESQREGSSTLVKLYASDDPNMPPDVAALPWPQINYLLNHKLGDAREIQTAIWMLVGSPGAEFPVTPAALAMFTEALRHPEFAPGPGQTMAVIAYSDGIRGNLQGFQELIFEIWLSGTTDTATPTEALTATPTGTATPTATLPPYPLGSNTNSGGFTFYFFGWRRPDWSWLLLLCCLPLLLLLLLPLLLLGYRPAWRLVERIITTTSQKELQTSTSSSARTQDLALLQSHQQSTRQMLSQVDRLQSELRERSALASRIAQIEQETRSRQSELQTALSTARTQYATAEELWSRIELALDRRGRLPERREETELWLREILRLRLRLREIQARIGESESDLALLAMLLLARRSDTGAIDLGRIAAAIEALELRLRVLLRRLEAGDLTPDRHSYELVIQMIEQIELRLERLRQQIGDHDTLIRDQLLVERVVAALLASSQTNAGLWPKLLRLRRELKSMRLRLVSIEEQRSSFSIEDVEIVPVGLIPGPSWAPQERRPAPVAQTTHLAPLISWSLVCAEASAGPTWRAIITLRNTYMDVVFTEVRIRLMAMLRAAGQIASTGLVLEFGDLRYSEAWLTHEVEIAGLVAERSEFVVCVVGTWAIMPTQAMADAPQVIVDGSVAG